MEDLINRLLDEHAEILERLKRLEFFLESNTFASITDEEKDMLHEQHEAMSSYMDILDMRVEYYTE